MIPTENYCGEFYLLHFTNRALQYFSEIHKQSCPVLLPAGCNRACNWQLFKAESGLQLVINKDYFLWPGVGSLPTFFPPAFT